ncbi:MAG: aminoglycoside phosphotransferase family protein [Nevskiales bacterium]
MAWLKQKLGPDCSAPLPASADASFRRYFRTTRRGRSYVVMDAPPEKEDCRPFVRIAALLHAAGLHAPEILAQDLQQGFLLLSDLGAQTYLEGFTEQNTEPLMAAALKALVKWQGASAPDVLPPYDETLLRRELELFPDWYVARHLGRDLSAEQRADWLQSCERLITRALAQARVYVHRDYMPRNLMISDPAPGVLDFQDAVYGPISYDIACLLKDAFLSWPAERVAGWRRDFWQQAQAAGLPVAADYAEFRRDFDLMGVQRHLKVLGIFARINYRDGKPHYLTDTPRFIRYIREIAPLYSELMPLLRLFDQLDLRA